MANHYDCILMDVYMPEIDGYESARRIRAFNETTIIIALSAATANATAESIEKK